MSEDLTPEDPQDVGLPFVDLTIEEVEPAHTLANDAREELRAAGFTDDEIDDWAREFAAHEDAGDTEAFIAWIKKEEAR